MMAAWMLYSAAVGLLIAVAARAGDAFLRAFHLPVRWLWAGGMVAALVLPGVALVRMQAPAPPSDSGTVLLPTAAEVGSADADRLSSAFAFAAGAARQVRGAAGAAMDSGYALVGGLAGSADISRVLIGAWLLGSAALALLLIGTLRRLNRARRTWRRHHIGDVPVLVSDVEGPALVGLLHPAIVVPVWLLQESPERQELVVVHEHEHLRARDHALMAGVCLIACLLPWNPALWWMLRRVRLAVELDCDARVLRRGAKARSYGSLLLDIAGRTTTRPFAAPAIADTRTHLERRIMAMTEISRTPRRARSAGAGAAALLLALVACTADMPTAADLDELDAASAQQQVERLGFLTTGDEGAPTLFFLDGVRVSEEEAQAVLADHIVSVELRMREAGTGPGAEGANQVRLRTLQTKAAFDSVGGFRKRVASPGGESQDTASASLRARTLFDTAAAMRRRSAVRFRATEQSEKRAMTGENSPLIIVDGVITKDGFRMNSMDPGAIERVEVLKGAAAQGLYSDPRAVNGVILITTKKSGSR